jgi:hypothetical protein
VGSIGLILTVRFTSGFSFRLPLMLLLIEANVNSHDTTTYALGVRRIFGYIKLVFVRTESKRFLVEIQLAWLSRDECETQPGAGTSFASPMRTITQRLQFPKEELHMDRGIDFLKSQVNNAVMQHQTLLKALEDHEHQAEDPRFRDLCSRHIQPMREHQRMLEEYQSELGAETGTGKKILGAALGAARDLADAARESDFLRLVGDIVMARQSEDTFKTFREAGKILNNERLQQIGDIGERHHDAYVHEANRLVQQLFVEHVQGVDRVARESATTQLNAAS